VRLLRPFRDRGVPFRRQTPIAPYIADFAWLSSHLVIEIDGGQHGEAAAAGRDLARTKWLEGQGFHVVRFWNNEVLQNPAGCYALIAHVLAQRGCNAFDD